jgi:membrane associated rhomboid family serine protease
MIPLRDDNPTRTVPVVTIALIVLNVLAFLYQMSIGLGTSAFQFGLIPAELVHHADFAYGGRGTELPPGVGVFNLEPAWLTVFTSMFMHGSIMHILGNMWYLWIFGNNVEDAMGKGRFLAFYLLSGIAAAALQTVLGPGSQVPMVGASGAIAGVLGAYLLLYPGSRVLSIIPLGIIWFTREVPAWLVLGFWFVIQLFSGLGSIAMQQQGGVAYAAHVGGFIFGLLFGRLMGQAEPPYGRMSRRYTPQRDYIDWR